MEDGEGEEGIDNYRWMVNGRLIIKRSELHPETEVSRDEKDGKTLSLQCRDLA